jgi:excisionase family DNA binding protein
MDTENERIMNVRDVAGYLRVHPSTIYRLLKFGQLPAFRVGADWRFNRETIYRWCSVGERSESKPMADADPS